MREETSRLDWLSSSLPDDWLLLEPYCEDWLLGREGTASSSLLELIPAAMSVLGGPGSWEASLMVSVAARLSAPLKEREAISAADSLYESLEDPELEPREREEEPEEEEEEEEPKEEEPEEEEPEEERLEE